jgi:PKD repeat protein
MKKAVWVLVLILLVQLAYAADVDAPRFDDLSPSAIISASQTRGTAPLTIAFIGIGIDPEGQDVSYYWDFGDGIISSAQAPVHTYLSPGTYTVTLRVEDPNGNKGTAHETIFVEDFVNLPPSVSMTASTLNGPAPLTVVFNALGIDPEGEELDYSWQIGSFSSSQQSVTYTFNNPGTYPVTVRATDPKGNSGVATETITVTGSGSSPAVSMTVSTTNGNAPLTVAATAVGSDPEDQPLAYYWDFGDGAVTSNRQNIVHTYYTPGTYTMRVTAIDPDDNRASASETIFVGSGNSAPTASMTISQRTGRAPLTIAFSGIGHDPDGDEITYTWNFGDGHIVENQQNVVHTFNRSDVYTVTLTVEDTHGNKATAVEKITVTSSNLAPSVVVSADPNEGEPPLTVVFIAHGYDPEDEELTYEWDFDDGTTATGQSVIHTFTYINSYEVKVTVKDEYGNTGLATTIINVGPVPGPTINMPPVAIASAQPSEGNAPLIVSFIGNGQDTDGEIVSYYWDFGDGYSSIEQNPVHVYNYRGLHHVHLFVKDDKGATASDSLTINVTGGINETASFTINLRQGWNLISLPVRPANTSINAVLDGVNYNSVWRKDSGMWQSYLAGLGGDFNTIEADRGYWIYANTADAITVTGSYGGSTYLNQGWNLAGYTTLINQEINSSLSEINTGSVWRWNPNAQQWESYLNALQSGDFTIFEPGRGYWIYAENPGTWVY